MGRSTPAAAASARPNRKKSERLNETASEDSNQIVHFAGWSWRGRKSLNKREYFFLQRRFSSITLRVLHMHPWAGTGNVIYFVSGCLRGLHRNPEVHLFREKYFSYIFRESQRTCADIDE